MIASVVAIAALVAATVFLVLNAQSVVNSFFPPAPATTQGQSIHDLYTLVFAIAVVIFAVVEGLIIWSVIRYRRRPGDDELPPQTHGHNVAELIWTIVPTVIVAFLFFVSWQTLNTVEATTTTPDLRVRVVGAQFQWTFEYLKEDGETTAFQVVIPQGPDGGLTLPAGKTTHITLFSADVIHSFYVPHFLFKRDVVPGLLNQFDLTTLPSDADQTFRGQCAELCGSGHRVMLFEVHVLAPDKFDAWYAAELEKAAASPSPAPSGAPPGSGGPPPGSGAPPPAGGVVEQVAENTQFVNQQLTASANTPFTIHFDNKDSQPHDMDIAAADGSGQLVFDGQFFVGPAAQDYQVPALAAGTYPFHCSIHSNMTGTLTVQ
jgi:cytochrome c oxidase subunit 2